MTSAAMPSAGEQEDFATVAQALRALGWRRTDLVLRTAFPQGEVPTSTGELAECLDRSGISAIERGAVPDFWRLGLDGALLARVNGRWVALVRRDGALEAFGGEADEIARAVRRASRIVHLRCGDEAMRGTLAFRALQRRVLRIGTAVMLLSLLANGLALSVPFFTMAIYDRVIGGGASSSLAPLVGGGVLAVVLMLLVRAVRMHILAGEHARLGATIVALAESRLLRQPITGTDRQAPGQVVRRIRQAESAAEVFSAGNVVTIFDAPFMVLSLVAIAIIGGWMAIIPIVYLALFVLLGLRLGLQRVMVDPEIARAAATQDQRLAELALARHEIRTSGASTTWLASFDRGARLSAVQRYAQAARAGALQSLGFVLGTGAALVTLVVGLELALAGEISAGALIALMMMVWRVTGPAQGLFLGLPRVVALRNAWRMLEGLLAAPTIAQGVEAQEPFPAEAPALDITAAYYRYNNDAPPALAGVTLSVKPGQVLLVLGPNGAGKSTLLRVAAGLLTPQSGNVALHGRTLRQFDPDDMALRSCVCMEPQVSVGSSPILRQEREWQRVEASNAAYFVLDDPLAAGGEDARARLNSFIAARRGGATIVVATHDVALTSLADSVLILNDGAVVYFGPVKQAAKPRREALVESA